MKNNKKVLSIIITCLVIVVLFAIYGNDFIKEFFPVEGELQIHFLELGNKYAGDCIFIKAGDKDILIDAGSRVNSIPTISGYIDNYCTDGVLEYVIVTHAHQDHYAGFATGVSTDSIFDLYECEVIIDFARTNQSPTAQTYSNYIRERNDEIANGATHYTARDCIEQDNSEFDLGDGITLRVLDSYYYYNNASSENDYSVCVLISQGERHFLFTGDLEEDGEEYLVEMNDIPEVEVYKAGHHGSKTSSCDALLDVIRPKHVAVCCCAGSSEYTDDEHKENQFPTQAFINRIAPYTDRVYVTTLCINYSEGQFQSMNGNIVFVSDQTGIAVNCSANNTKLKDTDWFKNNRITPAPWQEAA